MSGPFFFSDVRFWLKTDRHQPKANARYRCIAACGRLST
jgi:hypothetical protein